MLALICLLGYVDNVGNLIAELNHPQYWHRAEATKELKGRLDFTLFKRLEREAEKTDKPEVRHRCLGIVRSYTRSLDWQGIPSIWCLPKAYRFDKGGKDLAKEFFLKAEEDLKDRNIRVYGWRDDDCVTLATHMFLTDMMNDPSRFEEMPEVRKMMAALKKEEALVFSEIAFAEDGFFDRTRPVPPAIEDWIEACRKNKGNYVPAEYEP